MRFFSVQRQIVMKPAEFFGTAEAIRTRPNPYVFSLAMMGLGFVNVFLVCFTILGAFDDHTFVHEHLMEGLETVFALEGKTLAAYFVMYVVATSIVIVISLLWYSGGTTKMRLRDLVSIVLYLSAYEPLAALLIGLHTFSLSLLNPFQRSPLLPRVDPTLDGQIAPIVLIANLIAIFALLSFLIVRCGALVTAFLAFKANRGTRVQFFVGFAPVYVIGFWFVPSVIFFFVGLALSGFH